ncbi:MAG: DUF3450 domain-containing protein [Pseudohaliea sp.]
MTRRTRLALPILIALGASAAPPLPAQGDLERIEGEGLARSEERRESQATVDALNAENRGLLEDYRGELRIVRGLEDYVAMLDRQLSAQDEEITALEQSIGDVAVIERQILPLLARMLDSLESFIRLDVPFLLPERKARVGRLRAMLARSDVTTAEKARRVFEAYQVESDFGRTIEAYKAKIDAGNGTVDADMLRIGRVGLYYRTIGDGRLGYWNHAQGQWVSLPTSPYRRLVDQGLRVARQEIAPELVSIPLVPNEVERP